MSGESGCARSLLDVGNPRGRRYTDKAREQGRYSRALARDTVVCTTDNKTSSVIFLSVNIL